MNRETVSLSHGRPVTFIVPRWNRPTAWQDDVLVDALIERTPGVVGGSARIVRTRIPVWTLEAYRRQGATDAEILVSFPVLRAKDLRAAWAYVGMHPQEIERDIAENDAA